MPKLHSQFLVCLSVVSALPLVCAGAGVEASAPKRPHVLFIAIDDLKPLLGSYGAS